MAQKDLSLKALFRHDDVFADAINGLIFSGESYIQARDLCPVDTETYYEGEDGKLHELRRDVSRKWMKEGRIQLRISIENQTEALWYMPARTAGYDHTSYVWQFTKEEMQKKQTVYPCFTMVLYYGQKRWRFNRMLNEVFHIHERFRRLIPDYRMNLYEIAFLTQEEVKQKFHSDFRILADYLVQMRTTGKYELSSWPIQHVQETLQVMNAFTGRNWFSREVDAIIKAGREISMVSAYAEVRKEARAEGRSEGKISVYYQDMKLSPQEIADKIHEPLDKVLEVIRTLKS